MKQQSHENGSNNDEWETPEYLFDRVNEEFNFNWDLACISKNSKTKEDCFFDKGINGLEWTPDPNKEYRVWCNPPYSQKLKPLFIEKCYELSKLPNVKEVVLLIPSATETEQFHNLIVPNAEVRFIYKRVRFKGINTKGEYVTNKTGQSGSMLVIFKRASKLGVFK